MWGNAVIGLTALFALLGNSASAAQQGFWPHQPRAGLGSLLVVVGPFPSDAEIVLRDSTGALLDHFTTGTETTVHQYYLAPGDISIARVVPSHDGVYSIVPDSIFRNRVNENGLVAYTLYWREGSRSGSLFASSAPTLEDWVVALVGPHPIQTADPKELDATVREIYVSTEPPWPIPPKPHAPDPPVPVPQLPPKVPSPGDGNG